MVILTGLLPCIKYTQRSAKKVVSHLGSTKICSLVRVAIDRVGHIPVMQEHSDGRIYVPPLNWRHEVDLQHGQLVLEGTHSLRVVQEVLERVRRWRHWRTLVEPLDPVASHTLG